MNDKKNSNPWFKYYKIYVKIYLEGIDNVARNFMFGFYILEGGRT